MDYGLRFTDISHKEQNKKIYRKYVILRIRYGKYCNSAYAVKFLLRDEDYELRITDYALQISRTKSKTRKSIENM